MPLIDPDEYVFPFGLHKGHTYRYILKSDPLYIKWLVEQENGFELAEDDWQEVLKGAEEQERRILETGY